MKQTVTKKIAVSLIVSFYFSLTISLFAPAQIFLTNPNEFSILLPQLLTSTGIIAAIIFIFLSIILILLPWRYFIHEKAVVIVVAISFLFWLQGYVLVWNYGPLDGRDIHWNEYSWRGILDGLIWIAVIIVVFVKSTFFYKQTIKVGIAITIFQLITIGFYYFQQHESPSFKDYTLDESNKFTFSKDKNVIILVLDSFQPDAFQEIINTDTSCRNIFDGFTFFRNSLSGHPYTETSTANILTGEFYEGDERFDEHIKKAYLGNSIPKVLLENGYEVDLFPLVQKSIYYDPKVLSNFIKQPPSIVVVQRDVTFLYDLSLFRSCPHYLKKYIYNSQEWLLKQYSTKLGLFFVKGSVYDQELKPDETINMADTSESAIKYQNIMTFVNSMQNEFSVESERPTFKYYHIDIPHWPLVVNDSLKYERMDISRANFLRQSKAALKVAGMFIKKLKESNIYDNSLLFIIADHGAGAQHQSLIPQDGFPSVLKDSVVSSWQKINAIPLILIKSFNQRGVLRASNAPVSLSDIRNTIFDELNMEKDVPGFSFFDLKESSHRERRFIAYTSYDHVRDKYDNLTEWIVNGYSWLIKSWAMNNKVQTDNGLKSIQSQLYKYGDTLLFTADGNARQYHSSGWSYPESLFTWSDSRYARLRIPVAMPTTDLVMHVDFIPFIYGPKLRYQDVILQINGNKVNQWHADTPGDYTTFIPKRYIMHDTIDITFLLPSAIKPFTISSSTDLRLLGIALRSIVISKPSYYSYGKTITYSKDGNFSKYSGSGWSVPERSLTWTSGKESELLFSLSPPGDSVEMEAEVIPFICGDRLQSQHVEVLVNDNVVGTWDVRQPGKYSVSIPAKIISSGYANVSFHFPNAISPQMLGMNKDERVLALSFKTLVLREKPKMGKSNDQSATVAHSQYMLFIGTKKSDIVLIGPERKGIPVMSDSLNGSIDAVTFQNDSFSISGWSARNKTLEPAKEIILFMGNKNIAVIPTGIMRPDLVAAFKSANAQSSGFSASIPLSQFGTTDSTTVMRVFVVAKDASVASELPYPSNYPFRH